MKDVTNRTLVLFLLFALGLPIWAMQNNEYPRNSVHRCNEECYAAWKEETGGVVAIYAEQQAARAKASPVELGKEKFVGCIACHGSAGEGGIGPALAGQSAVDIADKLVRYKNGETIGSQSSLMWSQAAMLSMSDIENISAFVDAL